MQAIIDLIKQDTPIVLVHGLVGIGKSSVIKKVGLFFSQRQTFKDGVIYLSMRDRQFVNILNYKMHAFICQSKDENLLELNRYSSSCYKSGKSSQQDIFEEGLEESKVQDDVTELPKLKEDFRKLVD